MGKRTITGIILALLLIPAFWFGGLYLNIVLLFLAVWASFELFNMFNTKAELGKGVMITELILSGLMYFTIQRYYEGDSAVSLLPQTMPLAGIDGSLEWVFLTFVLLIVIGATLLVLVPKFSADNFGQLLVTVLYPALGFGAVFGLRSFSVYNIGFLFIITIFTDIFAYVVGVRWGKHRLAEHISPKKSIEGSIGGTVAAVILALAYIYIADLDMIGEIPLNIFVSILLILFISAIGQIGDLVASKLKRSYNIKDFSQIFPGHGGVLDRFDSLVFAGMVLMLLSKFVGIL